MYKFDFDRLYTREEVEDIEGWEFGTGSTYYKHMRILKNAYDVEIVKDDNDHRRKLFHIKNKKKEEETDFRKYNGKEPSIPNDVAFKIWDMYLRKLLNGSNKGRVYFGSTLLGKLFLGINNKRTLYDKLEPLDIPDVIRKKVVDEVYDKAKSLLVDKIMKHHGYSIRSKVLICVPKWETD